MACYAEIRTQDGQLLVRIENKGMRDEFLHAFSLYGCPAHEARAITRAEARKKYDLRKFANDALSLYYGLGLNNDFLLTKALPEREANSWMLRAIANDAWYDSMRTEWRRGGEGA